MSQEPASLGTSTAQTELLLKALATIASAIFITGRDGRIVWVNDAFCRLSGYSAAEAVGRTPSFLKSGRQNGNFYRNLWQTILAGGVWRGEVVERHKDGSLYTVDQVVTPIRDDNGLITHFVATHHDMTSRIAAQEREHFLAYHDALTGLPNRELFLRMVQQAIGDAKQAGQSLAVSFIDLDRFKPANDKFGHHFGDQLLIAVAQRLSALVRRTDTIARLGGDEFAILQTEIPEGSVAATLAQKLLVTIAQPFALEGKTAQVTASLGIALYPADGDDPDTLLRCADQAMYRAKRRGRNCYEFFS